MNKKTNRICSLLLASVLMTTVFAGCTKDNADPANSKAAESTATDATASPDATTASELAYYDMYDKVQDSSEFPDWTGKQLKLKAWYTHGTGEAKRLTASNDVVTPEIKRVTGVEIDKDTSFDNSGQSTDVKLAMLNAANDWPDIAFVSQMGLFTDMIAAGKVYDLTELLPKYAPNQQKKLSLDMFPNVRKAVTNNNPTGPVYAFPTELGDPDYSLKILNPEFMNSNPLNGPDSNASYPNIYVRDDVLKMLYPSAKTMDEIEALYLKNGTFTKEDMFDVPVKTKDDFIKFLYDIQNLIDTKGLQENGKPLRTTYAFSGTDNWGLMATWLPYINRIPSGNFYFTYFDKATKQIELMWKQDFFKQTMLDFNKMVRDGVMNRDSLLENNATFLENANSGQYVVLNQTGGPDESLLKGAGKTFRYRPLWLDSPLQTDKFIAPISPPGSNGILIFKDKVKEEDLPQVLRYLDYMLSDVGEKMYTWGPKSAGLFDEKDGKRVFKDKDLEAAMVYNADNGKALEYNLSNRRIATLAGGSAWPAYPIFVWGSGGQFSPYYSYDKERTAASGKQFFSPGNFPGNSIFDKATPLNLDPNIWAFFGAVPSTDKFWKSKDQFEKSMTKVLGANDDAQFEQLYQSFTDLADRIGGNDKMLEEVNAYFAEKNKGLLDQIK